MPPLSYARRRFPPVIIQHAVGLHLRFTLSHRGVEDLLAERGLDISHETTRRWVLKAARKPKRKLLRRQGFAPTAVTTGKPRSYGAAFAALGLTARHEQGPRKNDRAEVSHQPVRRRERKMRRFKSPGPAQRFVPTHAAIYNTFHVQRHLISRRALRIFRGAAIVEWRAAVA